MFGKLNNLIKQLKLNVIYKKQLYKKHEYYNNGRKYKHQY